MSEMQTKEELPIDTLPLRIEAHFERYPFTKKQITGGLLFEALTQIKELNDKVETVSGQALERFYRIEELESRLAIKEEE